MRCNINGQPFSNKLKTFSTGNVNASNQFNCRKIWWKRIRKANETKRMERNQMKRNNEIDLYIFFPFILPISHALQRRRKKLRRKSLSRPTDAVQSSKTINYCKFSSTFLRFTRLLQFERHSSFVAIHFGVHSHLQRIISNERQSVNLWIHINWRGREKETKSRSNAIFGNEMRE